MRIEDISKKHLLDATDLELKQLKFKIAKFWDRHFKNNNNDIVGCFKRDVFISKYRLLLKEMDSANRSLQHSTDSIDRVAFKQSMQAKADGIELSSLNDIVTGQNCVILDENFVEADKINITIQQDADEPDTVLEEELVEIFKEQFDKPCVFVYERNFNGSGIPLFHEVLQPVTKIEKIKIENELKESAEVLKSIELVHPIEKGDEQIVYGIVYEPNVKDSQGDQANANEIKKAAYDFMENAQTFKVMHKGKKVKVQILENFIAPVDFTIEKRTVKKGSWVLVTRVLDKKLWEEIKKGNLTGYSMAGTAKVS